MTIWRIGGGEGAPGSGERAAPRYDIVELDTALLNIAAASSSPWLRMAGEIDVSTAPGVAAALHAAQVRLAGDVHVDMAALAFMDVAGLRAFTVAAREMHDHGRLLVLHTVSPHIDRLFRLIGWHLTPGLTIHCRPQR
ncbi:STAS domain-containing protein [Actinomadura latina]|uniref:STAS domain-containing protein n=1 Tax=Actinomadura latina TaxID=163603 RepID=A0A846ZCA2_9ACTN|nr:STAS domain-containing protein [Actinomadura latina]NKZ08135.1 STAS domain-containing protein [Actinomadura latina]